MMKKSKILQVPNKIFVGCPWRNVKGKYENSTKEIAKHSALYFHIVGRDEHYQADDLLKTIENEIASSSFSIFDAKGGNANVSLEFGYAEGIDIGRSIFISTHAASGKNGNEKPVISDLSGKSRVQYSNEKSLRGKLVAFAKKHPYSLKFDKWVKTHSTGERKSYQNAGIKVIRLLDGKRVVRRDQVAAMLEAVKDKDFADTVLKELKNSRLVEISTGRYSTVSIV